MAGSFDVFRRYQRSMLVAVAILAMLAFFVLPPIIDALQSGGPADPVAATWQGGGIRERDLWRAGGMRQAMLQFLELTFFESGRDARSQPLSRDEQYVLGTLERRDEAAIVRTILLAREAEANGLVVGDDAVNRFLAGWTANRIRPERFERLVSMLRVGGGPVSSAEVFATLRQILAAGKMAQLFESGLGGDPPGAYWDIFRRFEQQATIEVVAVPVESFGDEARAPSEADLRALFDRFKDRLPDERSPDPGFMEPQRVSYEWVAAIPADLEAAAAQEVTEEQITKFYEENKAAFYRVQPTTPAAPDEEPAPTTDARTPTDPAAAPADPEAAPADPEAAPADPEAAPADPEAAPGAPAAPAGTKDEPAPAASEPEAPAAEEPQSAVPAGGRFVPVRFRQPAPPATEGQPADAAAEAGAATEPAPGATTAGEFEPLDKVRDDVRRRLAREAAAVRLGALFRAITVDVSGFPDDLARWQADRGAEADKPKPPNVETIAATQGLKAGRGEKRTAAEATRAGGVGGSYEIPDLSSGTMFEPVPWTARIFGDPQLLTWMVVETRDDTGARYLSWKTADEPAFVPEFAAARGAVEQAWRNREARGRAEAVAKEIAAGAAGGRSLAEAVVGRAGAPLEARTLGPFTWLTATFGAGASISQPEGLTMPGEELMRTVFALEPGGTAVAFNEPRTICYAIRLVSYTPAEEDLRRRFVDPASNWGRTAEVAMEWKRQAYEAWVTGVEKRAGLTWKRAAEPR